jgi:hypothetical protein
VPTPPFRRPNDGHRTPVVTGSGDIGFSQLGAGHVPLDSRATGFWAVIDAQDGTTNAYGFLRVDDGDGTGTYPTLNPLYTTAQGTGSDVPAWEVMGRTDVPSDGSVKVWLEPNRMGPGYTFKYDSGAAAVTTDWETLNSSYSITGTSTWQYTGHAITLPSAGIYLVTLQYNLYGRFTSAAPADMAVRLWNSTQSQGFPSGPTAGASLNTPFMTANVDIVHGGSITAVDTVTQSVVIQAQAIRNGATWTASQYYVASPAVPILTYLKLG